MRERQWQWNEPDDSDEHESVIKTITETEIREQYWPYWQKQMRKAGKEDHISFETCIEDFCVVHWAWPVDATTVL